jgi:hypothetical protein
MTGIEVKVGLNMAVMVKSGVANSNGVGDATKGKLQASIASANAPMARIGTRFFILTPASLNWTNNAFNHHYR